VEFKNNISVHCRLLYHFPSHQNTEGQRIAGDCYLNPGWPRAKPGMSASIYIYIYLTIYIWPITWIHKQKYKEMSNIIYYLKMTLSGRYIYNKVIDWWFWYYNFCSRQSIKWKIRELFICFNYCIVDYMLGKGWVQFCLIDYVGYIGHRCLIWFSRPADYSEQIKVQRRGGLTTTTTTTTTDTQSL